MTRGTPAFPAWREIAARIEALSVAESAADDVRRKAAATLDLLQLVATWPLPSDSGFRSDLAASLFDLCDKSGAALCAGRRCPKESNGAAASVCRLFRPLRHELACGIRPHVAFGRAAT